MLKEGYIAKWGTYPEGELKIRVAKPSISAPSEELVVDFMTKKKKLITEEGLTEWQAQKRLEKDYERRFRKEILSNPKAIARLREIKKLTEHQDVRLICYEKKPPCHRFILIDLVDTL